MTTVKGKNLFSQSKRLPIGSNVLMFRPTGKGKTWQIIDRMHEKSTQISSVSEQVISNDESAFNIPEIINFSASTSTGVAPLDSVLSWGLLDPNKRTTKFEIDYGDDSEVEEIEKDILSKSYTWSANGTYTAKIRLSYIDGNGDTQTSEWVELAIYVDSWCFYADKTLVEVDENIYFTWNIAVSQVEGDSIRINWQDGNYEDLEHSATSASHSYSDAGYYNPVLEYIPSEGEIITVSLVNRPIGVYEEGESSPPSIEWHSISKTVSTSLSGTSPTYSEVEEDITLDPIFTRRSSTHLEICATIGNSGLASKSTDITGKARIRLIPDDSEDRNYVYADCCSDKTVVPSFIPHQSKVGGIIDRDSNNNFYEYSLPTWEDLEDPASSMTYNFEQDGYSHGIATCTAFDDQQEYSYKTLETAKLMVDCFSGSSTPTGSASAYASVSIRWSTVKQ